jgi:hypothetical protein
VINLSHIPEIGSNSLQLLEAAGFSDCQSLAAAEVDELVAKLERANRILKISDTAPSRSLIVTWILSARTLNRDSDQDVAEGLIPINDVVNKDLISLLATAPFAIPLPSNLLVEQQLEVTDIPLGVSPKRHLREVNIKTDSENRKIDPLNARAVKSSIVMAEAPAKTRLVIDMTKVKSTDVLAGKTVKPERLRGHTDSDRVALIRGPLVETNLGRDPNSRFYIRGVLHSHPSSIRIGAFVTLLLAIVLPLAIGSAGLLLASDLMPGQFLWVPKWLLAFPFALPFVGIVYLICGLNSRCRICGQRQFVPRMCLKNTKAHHVKGLGYIIPVCFHILLFKWFRCIYCGTPVRLKK